MRGFYTESSYLATESDAGNATDANGCFKIDYSFLDNLSLDDPKLQRLLNDDLLKSK